jgi:hypothetical protein
VRLETVMIGGLRFTSVEALRRFFDRTGDAATGPGPTASEVRQRHVAAEKELDAAGL